MREPPLNVQRAAATRRARTRERALSSLERLLNVRDYDDISIADISMESGIGAATFYSACGGKATAVGDVFLGWYRPEVEALTLEEKKTGDLPSGLCLARHFARLGDGAAGQAPRRRTTRAFLRAYGSTDLGVASPANDLLAPVAHAANVLLNDIAAQEPNEARYRVSDLGSHWTLSVLIGSIDHSYDAAPRAVRNIIRTFLPDQPYEQWAEA